MSRTRPVLLAVDGFSGAGKSSLADELMRTFAERNVPAALFRLEDIYPGWDGLAAGMDCYRRQVLEPLAAGRPARWRAWDWEAGGWGAGRTTEPAAVVLCEGVGAFHAAARPLLDAGVWLQAPAALRRRRALARDGETYAPHWERWAAQERAWAAADDAAAAADLVLDGGAPGNAAAVLALLSGSGTGSGSATAPMPGVTAGWR